MFITARLLLVGILLNFLLLLLCGTVLAYGQNTRADVIAYVRESYRQADIYMIDLNTGIDVPLVERQVRDYRPVWSPDGSKLAFVRAGFGATLYMVNADGSHLRRMSPAENGILTMEVGLIKPGWTADGRQIVFAYQMPESQSIHRFEYMIVDVDDGHIALADENHPAVREYLRTFRRPFLTSPDQSTVLLISQQADEYGLMTQRVSDESIQFIHRFPGTDLFYSGSWGWSPDGSQVAFSTVDQSHRLIRTYVMNADGSHVRLLTGGTEVHSPAWRP